jgi:hypothetical protein
LLKPYLVLCCYLLLRTTLLPLQGWRSALSAGLA